MNSTFKTEITCRYGPRGGGEPIRIGLFAGVHGDEPEAARALVKFPTLLYGLVTYRRKSAQTRCVCRFRS